MFKRWPKPLKFVRLPATLAAGRIVRQLPAPIDYSAYDSPTYLRRPRWAFPREVLPALVRKQAF